MAGEDTSGQSGFGISDVGFYSGFDYFDGTLYLRFFQYSLLTIAQNTTFFSPLKNFFHFSILLLPQYFSNSSVFPACFANLIKLLQSLE